MAAKFLIEDDEEQMKEELKEAFRIYDKEGQGFITTDVLKVELPSIDLGTNLREVLLPVLFLTLKSLANISESIINCFLLGDSARDRHNPD